jgi:membrane protease YdiL (CAAX protease family)
MDRADEVMQEFNPAHQPGTLKGRRWQTWFIVAIGISIAVCEYVFAYHNVVYGIVIALALSMLIYFLISVVHFDENISNSAESLVLIPLYILFTSSLPWFFINQQYLMPAVYSCILMLCMWNVYAHKLSLKKIFGFNREKTLKYVLLGFSIGIPLGITEYFILWTVPASPTFEVQNFLRDVVYMLFFVGIGEELLFRGLIQVDLVKAFGSRWGVFGSAIVFAVMHLTWRSIPEIGFVFVAGVVLGVLYLKSKNLTAPIIAHATGNVLLVAVLPYIFRR